MGNVPSDTCAICMMPLKDNNPVLGVERNGNEIIQRGGCKHKFHRGCAVAWAKKSTSCPLCRNPFCLK